MFSNLFFMLFIDVHVVLFVSMLFTEFNVVRSGSMLFTEVGVVRSVSMLLIEVQPRGSDVHRSQRLR
jgi:hypothetical protein